MYGWIWRHLPGPTGVRALIALMLVVGVLALLMLVVFPRAVTIVPGQEVSIEGRESTLTLGRHLQ